MSDILDWNSNRDMWIRVLLKQSGAGLEYWNAQVNAQEFKTEANLRDWLTHHGISGYAANLLVMECFGYPDFVTATADDLLNGQFDDRPHLRPIYDALIAEIESIGTFSIQMRKSYVSLLTTRRTFARIKPSTKSRVDVALRLTTQPPGGRLSSSKIHQSMPVQLSFSSVAEIDTEAVGWLRLAFQENS